MVFDEHMQNFRSIGLKTKKFFLELNSENRRENDLSLLPDLPKSASIIKYFHFQFFGSEKVLDDHFDPTFGGVIGLTFWARRPLTLTFCFEGLIFASVFQIKPLKNFFIFGPSDLKFCMCSSNTIRKLFNIMKFFEGQNFFK